MKKSEKTEITVSRILESAMSEFGNKGYAGGTVNNICKTGINKGLLYHKFAGKDALYLTCLKRSSEKMIGYVRECGGAKDLKGYSGGYFSGHSILHQPEDQSGPQRPCSGTAGQRVGLSRRWP